MVVEYAFDVFPNLGDYEQLLEHLRNTGWKVHAEALPRRFVESRKWDKSITRSNDARQIWAFRTPVAPDASAKRGLAAEAEGANKRQRAASRAARPASLAAGSAMQPGVPAARPL